MSADVARPLIVEFVGGIPGAGKTTIARSCETLATSLGYSICRQGAAKQFMRAMGKMRKACAFVRAPLFYRTMYYSLKSPLLTRGPDESFLAYRWRCLAEPRWYFVMLYEFTRNNANSMIIVDQGISWKLNIIDDERRAADVLRLVARSDVYFDRYYVFLDVPVEVATDRAWRRAKRRQSGQERGWIRDLFLDRTGLYQSYIERYYPFYERRYSLFQRQGMKVLRLDGERSAEDNARLIIDRIIQPYVTNGGGRTLGASRGEAPKNYPKVFEGALDFDDKASVAAPRPRDGSGQAGKETNPMRYYRKPRGASEMDSLVAANSSSSQKPTLTVKVVLCICTCKRPVGLARLLEAVAELDFEGQLSVVVVDNDAVGAAEGFGVCRGMAAAGYRWPLACVGEERRGISFARNRVVTQALEQDPDFIAILDDDERPWRGWLREMLRVQAETGADAVGGPVLPEFEPGAPAWLIEGKFFERHSHPDKAEIKTLHSIGNVLAKACCFRALMPEPFDTRCALTGGEGGVFFRHLATRNYTMRWAANAHIFESLPPSRANLRWLMQRRFRLGVNTVQRRRMLKPGAVREVLDIIKTLRSVLAGLISFIINCRQRIRRTHATLRICNALGRAAGHLGVRYSEYRRIHGA